MAQSSGADLSMLIGPVIAAMDNFGSLPLFPIFDWAHYTLMTIALRDDAGAGKVQCRIRTVSWQLALSLKKL